MKKIVLIALLLTTPAMAQQQPVGKTFEFKNLTVDEANMMLNQLGKLPWADVNPLMQKLIAQINAQNQPTPPPAPKE